MSRNENCKVGKNRNSWPRERSEWFVVQKSGGISSGRNWRKALLGSNERNKGGARAKLIIDKTINLCRTPISGPREKADPIGPGLYLSSRCFSVWPFFRENLDVACNAKLFSFDTFLKKLRFSNFQFVEFISFPGSNFVQTIIRLSICVEKKFFSLNAYLASYSIWHVTHSVHVKLYRMY